MVTYWRALRFRLPENTTEVGEAMFPISEIRPVLFPLLVGLRSPEYEPFAIRTTSPAATLDNALEIDQGLLGEVPLFVDDPLGVT